MTEEIKNEQVETKVEEQVEEASKEKEIEVKEKITGIKSEVSNDEAIGEVEKKEKEDIKFEFPSLFVNEKKIKVGVDILFDPSDGKPLMMIGGAKNDSENELKFLKRTREWMEFTHPTYDDMTFYRENSMSFDKNTNQFLSDPVKMRIHYLKYHLKDWSLRDNEGKKIELKFDNDRLDEGSINVIGKLSPSLVDIFLSEFEKEAMLG